MQMFALTRLETQKIMQGLATGCIRNYGGDCPHEVGNEIVLTSMYLDTTGADRQIPFARAQVVSVRPGTAGEFRRDPIVAEMDGFENGEVLFGHLNQMYRGVKETDRLHHIKFRVIEIDKMAGRRGNVKRED
jgi:hypothetical protein